ncbi:hypothetical protein CA267_006725 [Alteromonas pelagimontana]|uniref:STAS/SEC14 domain-containing protein n=1 Tax=Alteromonas pelagimontana TaxID=1858656 RepID=A0A6M4MBT6_9ALTE|nr:hypothetical protein [Alteromonas pelagimontana]QJR80489.1 hypothetical protein CA267_006725 [Alteromonas pelagimontana]
MRFPKYGHYTLEMSGNMLEVFATGAWNLATTEAMVEEMHVMVKEFNHAPWAALMDGRRWIFSTPDCQQVISEAIKRNIDFGLKRSAYVLDSGMVKKAQLERTHPAIKAEHEQAGYQRRYFSSYFAALSWLQEEGYTPYGKSFSVET